MASKKATDEFEDAITSIALEKDDRFNKVKYLHDINEQDCCGVSLLWEAVLKNDLCLVKQLLSMGANPNITTNDGWTPLHLCAQNYYVECAKILISNHADVNHKDKWGKNVISVAAYWSENRGEMINLLLSHGANPHDKNYFGISAIDIALTIANYDVKQFFKDYLPID